MDESFFHETGHSKLKSNFKIMLFLLLHFSVSFHMIKKRDMYNKYKTVNRKRFCHSPELLPFYFLYRKIKLLPITSFIRKAFQQSVSLHEVQLLASVNVSCWIAKYDTQYTGKKICDVITYGGMCRTVCALQTS